MYCRTRERLHRVARDATADDLVPGVLCIGRGCVQGEGKRESEEEAKAGAAHDDMFAADYVGGETSCLTPLPGVRLLGGAILRPATSLDVSPPGLARDIIMVAPPFYRRTP